MEFNPEPQKRIVVMESCKNMRKLGRTALEGNWVKASLVAFMFYALIEIPVFIINYFFGREIVVDMAKQLNLGPEFKNAVYTVTFSPMSNLYQLLIMGPMIMGLTMFFVKMFRTKDGGAIDLFKGSEQFVRNMGLFLYMFLFTMLWSLIPLAGLILGPIAALRYSQSFIIMLDHPEYPIPMCVNESKRMMMLNKGKLFLLMLSFLGWILLAGLISGIIGSIVGMVTMGGVSDFGSMSEPMQFSSTTTFLLEIVSGLAMCPVMAYMCSTSVAFYEILTGKIQAEVYYPGEY